MFNIQDQQYRHSLEVTLLLRIGETGRLISRKYRPRQGALGGEPIETWKVPEIIARTIWVASIKSDSRALIKALVNDDQNKIDQLYDETTRWLKAFKDMKAGIDTAVDIGKYTIRLHKPGRYCVVTVKQANTTLRFVYASISRDDFLDLLEKTPAEVTRKIEEAMVLGIDNMVFKEAVDSWMRGAWMGSQTTRHLYADERLIVAETVPAPEKAVLTPEIRSQILEAVRSDVPLNAVAALSK